MKNTKRILSMVLIVTAITALCSVGVFAAGYIETDRDVTLDIVYRDNGKNIPEAQYYIYKVADIDKYARYTLTDNFMPYENTVKDLDSINGIDSNSKWLSLAATLKGTVQQNGIAADAADKTDVNGELNLTLKPGLYLIFADPIKTDDYYVYTVTPFMLVLPAMDLQYNVWDYDLTVEPKFEGTPPEVNDLTVVKVWDDKGKESRRPDEVTVHLLANGEEYDTQILNKENNWQYCWKDLVSEIDWTVTEDPLDEYKVAIERDGDIVFVTNTSTYVPPAPPEIPHTGVLWWPVPALLGSGVVSLMIGMVRRRRSF